MNEQDSIKKNFNSYRNEGKERYKKWLRRIRMHKNVHIKRFHPLRDVFSFFIRFHPLRSNQRWHISCDDIIIFQPTCCNWCHQQQKKIKLMNIPFWRRMCLKWRTPSQQDGKLRPDKMRGHRKRNKCYEEDIAFAFITTTKANIKRTEYRTAMRKKRKWGAKRHTRKKSY